VSLQAVGTSHWRTDTARRQKMANSYRH
jgi:hypothetical protein